MVGDKLTDARAKVGMLQVHGEDPAADDAALRRLALWATRYTPAVSPWDAASGADGLFLDVTGAAHLFNGEKNLLADLGERLTRFGLSAQLAVADTTGTAWALSHYAPGTILPSGREANALTGLPIEALRLSSDTRVTLRRLGFKQIGSLLGKPRAPFAARFDAELLRRLDQALGHASEPLSFVVAPPVYHSLRYLLEPIVAQEAIVTVTTRLMKDLVHPLTRDGAGARTLRLTLYRVDGEVSTLGLGLTVPSRSPEHVARLIDLKLERINLGDDEDASFGFEALDLAVMTTEPMAEQQTAFASVSSHVDRAERRNALIDRLKQRLGVHRVRQFMPLESHLPETAEAEYTADTSEPAWPAPDDRSRPVLILPEPEPADDVIASVPEGPPHRFRWRGLTYHIKETQGPERIASEWWRREQPTRDYYLVEDGDGHRFWMFRAGLYWRDAVTPRWFVHGLSA